MRYTTTNMIRSSRTLRFLLMAIALMLSLVGAGFCEVTLPTKDEIKASPSSEAPTTTVFSPKTKASVKPLEFTVAPSPSTNETTKTTKAYASSESPTTVSHSTAKVHASTKGVVKSARRQKLNTSSSGGGNVAHSPARLQERLGAIDCDLPVLPRESRLWRGNETHELNLPATECAGGSTPGEEECPPVVVSWEGSADIQIGDILIVRISDSLLVDSFGQQVEVKNTTLDGNSTLIHADKDRGHSVLQPAVYQVTRQGHEHCDVSDGMLLDITPLDEGGSKLFTLYDKDLTEGVNLLIVVSEHWGSKCVRLKVTVKSDNCGDSQDCSGKGVCYTNVSMEGYECQCCPGFAGPHCEERDACHPSPCLNNGVCVELSQPLDGVYYACTCPYGYSECGCTHHTVTPHYVDHAPALTTRDTKKRLIQCVVCSPATPGPGRERRGFSGKRCEKDPCSTAPCLNGGSCMTMAMNGSTVFHCACADGWAGARCELSVAGGACATNPCVKGICIEQTDNDIDGQPYRCFCQPGYTGERCEQEYNECESSPCANGGTCIDRVAGYMCACGRGYAGRLCQLKVDLCSPNPCPPRRYCMNRGNNYVCECPRGFVGEECHIPTRSACDNNPCAHGGTCWSGVDSFYCSCRPGYTGKLCEEDFILESVVSDESNIGSESRGGGSVREVRLPLGLYHDRLHNVYIAAGTLGAAIAIVGVVVTACHCRVNKTYSRLLSRLSRVAESGPPHHWLQDKRAPPLAAPFPPPSSGLDTTDMYYTLDFSDSQSSPLIQ